MPWLFCYTSVKHLHSSMLLLLKDEHFVMKNKIHEVQVSQNEKLGCILEYLELFNQMSLGKAVITYRYTDLS